MSAARLRDALRYARDRFIASDPAWARLRTGARALLVAGLGALLLVWPAAALNVPNSPVLLGVVIGLMSTVVVQDSTRVAQLLTFAGVALVASACVILAAVVADSAWLSGGFFLAIIFAAFEVRRLGPRATALGTIAYQAYFYALLLKPDAGDWGWLFASSAAGCALSAAITFWVLPDHPAQLLRSSLRAVQARVAAVLYELARSLERPAKRRMIVRARGSLAKLNDQGLEIEQQLGRLATDARAVDLRERLLRCELAAESIAECARTLRPTDAREPLAALLLALRACVRGDSATAPQPPAVDALPLDAAHRWLLQRAMTTLATEPPWTADLPALHGPAAADVASGGQSPVPVRAKRPGWDEPTRQAVQATAGAFAAMLVGRAIDADHWYWAVFGGFVVFTRGISSGQAVAGAWKRILANVAGLLVGLAFAQLVHASRELQLVFLFVFIALGFYAYRAFQVVYTVLLTAMLAMLYELMGHYTPGLLLLRMKESVAGAALALVTALLVAPLRTRAHADAQSAQLLREAAKVLREAFATPRPMRPSDALRDLDRQLQGLRRVLGPVTDPVAPEPKSAHRRRLQRLARLVHCVRQSYELRANEASGRAQQEALEAQAHEVASEMGSVAVLLAPDAKAAERAGRASPPPPDETIAGTGEPALTRLLAGSLREASQLLVAIRDEASSRA